MRPSKRTLWTDLHALRDALQETSVTVTSEVVTLTDDDSDPVDVPEDARIVETESDAVTVWARE